MTAREAIAIVRRILPKNDICVDQSDWHYNHLPVGKQSATTYRLSIQPGLNGSKCTGFEGENVQECVEKFSEALANAIERAVDVAELAADALAE